MISTPNFPQILSHIKHLKSRVLPDNAYFSAIATLAILEALEHLQKKGLWWLSEMNDEVILAILTYPGDLGNSYKM